MVHIVILDRHLPYSIQVKSKCEKDNSTATQENIDIAERRKDLNAVYLLFCCILYDVAWKSELHVGTVEPPMPNDTELALI